MIGTVTDAPKKLEEASGGDKETTGTQNRQHMMIHTISIFIYDIYMSIFIGSSLSMPIYGYFISPFFKLAKNEFLEHRFEILFAIRSLYYNGIHRY